MAKLLEVKDLFVTFQTHFGLVQAVRGVSFSVEKGETVAIVGESGSGKSVTASAIMRLLTKQNAKATGEIWFEGKDLLQASRRVMCSIRGREIGMIFQDPMTSLNPQMRIGKQIMEVLLRHYDMKKEEAKAKVIEMLHWVGISDPEKRIDQYPHQFSGGMRQRVMIAIALIAGPKLLIADEPTTALDVTIQAQILELMKTIQSQKQTSIILITHDLGIVAGMCDRVMVMYGGKIVETGTVEQIYHKPFHPYTHGLLRSVPRLDMKKQEKLFPIIGTPPHSSKPPPGCPFAPRCGSAMKICKERMPEQFALESNHHAACWLKESSGG